MDKKALYNYTQKNSEKKYKILITIVLTILYILLITKISDIISNSNEDEIIKIEKYAIIIYFLSIMGLVVAFFMLNDKTNKGNYIIKNSLSFGSVALLIYVMFYYWNYLGDYSKLSLIAISIVAIIYYIYN
jgi:hypothetical protein